MITSNIIKVAEESKTCDVCNRKIKKGERYISSKVMENGYVFSVRTHLDCNLK